jgi:TetR/AcrR family transcriptional repressor of nem operon
MRYPADQKAETHKKIVEAAARSFREHGSEGQGIAALMKDLGLTHGGFYKHFESKEDLFVNAVQRGLEEIRERMLAVARGARKGEELHAIIEYYLSLEHLQHIGGGCAIAALGQEIGRQPVHIRAQINATQRATMVALSPFLPGKSVVEKRNNFFVLFSGMTGAMVMARTIADPAVQKEILAAAKKFYLDAFVAKA